VAAGWFVLSLRLGQAQDKHLSEKAQSDIEAKGEYTFDTA
jgi:hypothetical protein